MSLMSSGGTIYAIKELEKTIQESNRITARQNIIMIFLTVATVILALVNIILLLIK